MPSIYIKEYRELARDASGQVIAAGLEPAITTQVLTIGVASVASAAFSDKTFFIEFASDTDCHYEIGADPTAIAASSMNLAAGVVKFTGVRPNEAMKLAVIQE